MMLFTSVTICFTISTEGSGASVAGIMLTSFSEYFDSCTTLRFTASFIDFLSIVTKSLYLFGCKDT